MTVIVFSMSSHSEAPVKIYNNSQIRYQKYTENAEKCNKHCASDPTSGPKRTKLHRKLVHNMTVILNAIKTQPQAAEAT